MNALILLLTIATSTLVLRSGDRIALDGPAREENGIVTFRSNGLLYSLPLEEIDLTAANAPPPEGETVRRLRLPAEERERLLRDLERNHAGTPSTAPAPTLPTRVEEPAAREDEGAWRARSRAHEEAVRRAYEDLQLLENRIEGLRQKIFTLTSLGYRAHQFTYDTAQLVRTQERIPAARLEITRAERALEQFREDARRAGIPPGWLR